LEEEREVGKLNFVSMAIVKTTNESQ
jgi:hypothetical protein